MTKAQEAQLQKAVAALGAAVSETLAEHDPSLHTRFLASLEKHYHALSDRSDWDAAAPLGMLLRYLHELDRKS
jgi:hypothetical protein